MSETAAERNRRLMPNAARIIDEFRRQFPDCKVTYAKDLVTGHSIGTPTTGAIVVSPTTFDDKPRKEKKR